MADTIRSRADLLTLLADNTTGDISAQDIRDTLVSAHGVYGIIYVADGSTAQSGINSTPAKLTAFATNGPSAGTTPDHANDQITVGTAGVYLVLLQLSFSGSVSVAFECHIYVDAVDSGFGFHRTMGTGGDRGSASALGLVTCTGGEVFTVYVTSGGPNDSMTVIDGQLAVLRVA